MAKSRGKRSPVVPILIALAVILVGGWAMNTFFGSKPVSILLLGLDEGKIRADVIVLVHVDPKQGLVNLLSIPRDTLVTIDCDGLNENCVSPDKLAHAHAYGEEDGAEVTVRTVEKLLDIEIDHYVRADFEGFKQVVDALGGVDLVIDQNMDYEDPYARPPLKIHFTASPEPQRLDGTKALNYVRFRSDAQGDIGRTERTKRFLVALAMEAKKPENLARLPSLVSKGLSYVQTDIDVTTALAMSKSAITIDLGSVQMATLPGGDDRDNPRGWVWVPDEAKTAEVVERLIKNPKPPTAEEQAK